MENHMQWTECGTGSLIDDVDMMSDKDEELEEEIARENGGYSMNISSVNTLAMGNSIHINSTNVKNKFISKYDIRYFNKVEQTRADLEMNAGLFEETIPYCNAIAQLKQHGLVIIVGPPCSGKSTTGSALLRYFSSEHIPLDIRTPEEWRDHVGEQKQIVLLDNVFGEIRVNDKWLSEWSRIFNNMVMFAKESKCLTVMTLHGHIYTELNREFDQFRNHFSRLHIVDLENAQELGSEEKNNMIIKYLNQRNEPFTDDIIRLILAQPNCGPFFPWCLKTFVDMLQVDDNIRRCTKIFTAPALALMDFFSTALRDEENGIDMAAMLLLTMSKHGSCLCSLEELERQLHQIGIFGLSQFKVHRVRTFAQHYLCRYISESGSFSNRWVYEAAGLALNFSAYGNNFLRILDAEMLQKYTNVYFPLLKVVRNHTSLFIDDTIFEKYPMEVTARLDEC